MVIFTALPVLFAPLVVAEWRLGMRWRRDRAERLGLVKALDGPAARNLSVRDGDEDGDHDGVIRGCLEWVEGVLRPVV